MFPVNFIANHPGKSAVDVNSLMNIAYLTQLTNIRISDDNPIAYISDLDVLGFAEVLPTHLVPPIILEWARCKAMPENALDQFVQARAEEFLARLREELVGIPFQEFESKSLSEILELA